MQLRVKPGDTKWVADALVLLSTQPRLLECDRPEGLHLRCLGGVCRYKYIGIMPVKP